METAPEISPTGSTSRTEWLMKKKVKKEVKEVQDNK